jgi:D-galactarolactone cycloisomerase
MIFDLCHGCRNDARLHDPIDTLGEAGSVASLSGTTIDRADVLVLRHPLSRTRYFSTGSNVTRDSVVVRMSDRGGRVGWGETYLVPGAVAAARAMTAGLPGLTPTTVAARLTQLPTAHRWALGAVSMATDDLRSRQQGVPFGTLYGERVRDRVQAYASSAGYVTGEDLADTWLAEAGLVQQLGFRHMKLRIGRYPLSDELSAIEAVHRGVVGLGWMADGNGAYGFEDGSRLGRMLHEMGFLWLEEPVPTDDLDMNARLTRELDIPIAGGESIETFDAASAAVAAGAYDIIQPDASICGGVGTLLGIAAMASVRGVGCVPHACNGAISLAATLQVLSVLSVDGPQPGGVPPMLEHDVGENPLRSDLLRDPLTVRDGWLAIPAGPGLGVEVDEAAVNRFAIPWP